MPPWELIYLLCLFEMGLVLLLALVHLVWSHLTLIVPNPICFVAEESNVWSHHYSDGNSLTLLGQLETV